MYNLVFVLSNIKRNHFFDCLCDQPVQKKSNILCSFRQIERKGTYMLCLCINFISNKVFLHKKLNVLFYLGNNVFFSRGLHL